MESVISQLPCVIWDEINNEYAPKGWYYSSRKEWVKDVRKAKSYRCSAGAKNAMRGAFSQEGRGYHKGPKRKPIVLEFHTEFQRS